MHTVMVTGVGAVIGYGILRSLRRAGENLRLVGADVYSDAVGRAWCDDFASAPWTAEEGYAHWLAETVRAKGVDLLIPGIEQDVHFLSSQPELVKQLGCKVVLNNQRLIELSRDKWLMHEELRTIESEARIPSYLVGDFATLSRTLGLPFLLKPRRGYASKGLVRVLSEADFQRWADRLGAHLVAQPIVGDDDEEYTVAVFGDGEGLICASLCLQRRLAVDGSTAKAWVRSSDSLQTMVHSLCEHFQPSGPTNLQFRKSNDGWKLLEINPRVSSSTSLRAAFGYNEADMCVRHYLHGTKIVSPVIKPGFAVRYIEDYVVYDRDSF